LNFPLGPQLLHLKYSPNNCPLSGVLVLCNIAQVAENGGVAIRFLAPMAKRQAWGSVSLRQSESWVARRIG